MMKLLLIFSLSSTGLIFAFTENEVQDQLKDIPGIVNDTINGLIHNMTDPFKIDPIFLKFENNSLISGGANVSKLLIGGIHEVVASYIEVDVWTQTFNMSIDISHLDVSFKYSLDTVFGDLVPLYGAGLNSIFFEGITFNIIGKVDVLAKKFHNVTANLAMDKALFNLDGILDNPEFSSLVNLILDDNFCRFIKDYQEFVSEVVSGFMNAILSAI